MQSACTRGLAPWPGAAIGSPVGAAANHTNNNHKIRRDLLSYRVGSNILFLFF